MNYLIYLCIVGLLITGTRSNCVTFKTITDSIEVTSPGFPRELYEHDCLEYRHSIVGPPGTTLSIYCDHFLVQCVELKESMYFEVLNTRYCGDSLPPLTTESNTLVVHYSVFYNYISRLPRWFKQFKFRCYIQVNYAEPPSPGGGSEPPHPEVEPPINPPDSGYPPHPEVTPPWPDGTNPEFPTDFNPPDSESECVCGQRNSEFVDFKQGLLASEGEFPYHVYITSSAFQYCSGALISDQWVITALQCDIKVGDVITLGIIVRVGDSPMSTEVNVQEVINNPVNELSLLKMEYSIEFSDFISPICLPEILSHTTLIGKELQTSGWTSEIGFKDKQQLLEKTSLELIGSELCLIEFNTTVPPHNFCGVMSNMDNCWGEPGAPVMYQLANTSFIIGITVIGAGCKGPGQPGIYINLVNDDIIIWIYESTHLFCFPPVMPPEDLSPLFPDASMIPKCDCGTREAHFPLRIVGGQKADAGEFPYQVSLIDSSGAHFCGGTLISEQWIMTAAHCSVSNSARARLGAHQRQSVSLHERTAGIKEVVPHPHYDEETNDMDISLIQMNEPVSFTDYIRPICLPDPFINAPFDGEQAEVTGWGYVSETGTLSDFLQKVLLDVITNDQCSSLYGRHFSDIAVCAMTPGKDACQGDSGGPMAYYSSGRFYILGVTSWGIGCARQDHPGVYTRVTLDSTLFWIKEITGIACEAPLEGT